MNGLVIFPTFFKSEFGLPWCLRWKSVCLQCRRPGLNPWLRKVSLIRRWQPTPVFLPGKSHGWRSLVGYSPWGCKRVGHNLWTKQQKFKTILDWVAFICWWTSRLLPCPGYYKQCCDEHWGTRVSFNSGFLGMYAQQWDCWVIRQFYFLFFKESPHCSP